MPNFAKSVVVQSDIGEDMTIDGDDELPGSIGHKSRANKADDDDKPVTSWSRVVVPYSEKRTAGICCR
jgi:hypothetical protein